MSNFSGLKKNSSNGRFWTALLTIDVNIIASFTLFINRSLLFSVLALLPLLGITWILGLLFVIDDEQASVATSWIFTLVNTLQVRMQLIGNKSLKQQQLCLIIYLQGAAIFFFHVVRNKEVCWVFSCLHLSNTCIYVYN